MKKVNNFLIFPQNIYRGYTLEPPQSNRVPKIYVLEQKQEEMYTPVNPSFTISKWGARWCKLHGRVCMMYDRNNIQNYNE